MLLFVLAVIVSIQAASAYSIQGNWSLVGLKGIAKGNQSVVMRIEDYIFKKQQILQKISLIGCKQIFLQSEVSQDQLFINYKSYFTQSTPNITCGPQNTLDRLNSALFTVFSFRIHEDILQFYNPFGQPVVIFKKIIGNVPVRGISGIWSINQFGKTSTSLSAQINTTQIALCQGNLIFNYTLSNSSNTINLTPVLSNCSSKEFTSAFQKIKYYRVFKGVLKLYDSAIEVVFQLTYSSPYDPAKPIFAGAQNKTLSTKSQSAPIGQSSPSNISVSNLAGRWTVSSLFNIPFPSTPYFIVIGTTTLSLSGGCNNYTYAYTINSTSQIITIGNATSNITKACAKSDDSLYISGITKMNKYLLSNSNGKYTLNFYDKTGNIGYSLKTGQSNQPQTKGAVSRPPPQVPVSLPLRQGTYLLLILSRRDLPRVLVKVVKNELTYKSCNSIKQVFLPAQLKASSSNISFTGGPTSSNNCTVNNDQIYYSTLNSAKSYAFDSSANSIIFSNALGKEIATLSQTG